MQPPRVGDVGERALLARLRARLPAPAAGVLVGVGDDAAVVDPPRGALEVLTADALVEGVHFDLRYCGWSDVGHRALAVNLSDLAAMGAEPRLALLSLGLPDSLLVDAFDALIDGFLAAAAVHRVALVGGNLTRAPGGLFVDVTAVGTARRRRVLTRGGGRPGEELYVTGTVGGARAGLAWLMQSQGTTADEAAADVWADAVARYRRPEPRVRLGVRVARSRAASACMDLSDGLADAITQIADASDAGVAVELDALPCHPAVEALWPDDPRWQALVGGDDYELLFVVPPRRRRAFLAAVGQGRRVPVTRIGRLLPRADGRWVRRQDGRQEALPAGYEHFA